MTAFNKAADSKKDLKKGMILWSAHSHTGITSEKKTPKDPKDSNVLGWQYGNDVKCYNHIETNY